MKEIDNDSSDFLHNKLFNYEEDAGEHAWERLEADLNRKRKRPFFWWWLLPIMAVLTGTLFTGYFYFAENEAPGLHSNRIVSQQPSSGKPVPIPIEKKEGQSSGDVSSPSNLKGPALLEKDRFVHSSLPSPEQKVENGKATTTSSASQKRISRQPSDEKVSGKEALVIHSGKTTKTGNQPFRRRNKALAHGLFALEKNGPASSDPAQEKEMKSSGFSAVVKPEAYRLSPEPNTPTETIDSRKEDLMTPDLFNPSNSVVEPIHSESSSVSSIGSSPSGSAKQNDSIRLAGSPPADSSENRSPSQKPVAIGPSNFEVLFHLGMGFPRQEIQLERRLEEFEKRSFERYQNIRNLPMIDFSARFTWKLSSRISIGMGLQMAFWQQEVSVRQVPGQYAGPVIQASGTPGLFLVDGQIEGNNRINRQLNLLPGFFPYVSIGLNSLNNLSLRGGPRMAGLVPLKVAGTNEKPDPELQWGAFVGLAYQISNWELETRLMHQNLASYGLPGVKAARSQVYWIGFSLGYKL